MWTVAHRSPPPPVAELPGRHHELKHVWSIGALVYGVAAHLLISPSVEAVSRRWMDSAR